MKKLSKSAIEYIKSDVFKLYVERQMWYDAFYQAPEGLEQEISDWLLENDLNWIEEASFYNLRSLIRGTDTEQFRFDRPTRSKIVNEFKSRPPVKIPKIDPKDIQGITLLSIEEAEDLPEDIGAYGDSWWLRSPGYYQSYAAFVTSYGSVYAYGHIVNFNTDVRPALIISNLKLVKLYGEVEIFGRTWIKISDDMVLAIEPIFGDKFDDESNDYDTSYIKKKLEAWLEEQRRKF